MTYASRIAKAEIRAARPLHVFLRWLGNIEVCNGNVLGSDERNGRRPRV